MKVLVSDTSALVDLERGSLLDAAFRLPFEFVVPDLLYERELKGHGGERLLERGVRNRLPPDARGRAPKHRPGRSGSGRSDGPRPTRPGRDAKAS